MRSSSVNNGHLHEDPWFRDQEGLSSAGLTGEGVHGEMASVLRPVDKKEAAR